MMVPENINTRIDTISDYFKTAISVDCVIFGFDDAMDKLKVLTLACDMEPFKGRFSLVGDLVRSSESLDEAAYRILQERAGLSNVFLDQFSAFGKPQRHPVGRVISVAYFAIIRIQDYKIETNSMHKPSWQPIENLDSSNMAFDHAEILEGSLVNMQKNILDLPVELMLPSKFTLSQLQSLYEAILGEHLDKRNFRKKIRKTGLIRETKEVQRNVSHRPAKLFVFDRSEKARFA